MIKYILTDLDGVIRIWDNSKTIQLESKLNITEFNILSICFDKKLINSVICGEITDSEWRNAVKENYSCIHNNIDTKDILDSWNNSEYTIDHSVLKLYKNYFPKAKIVLVTNATSKLNYDMEKAKIIHLFDYVFNSSEMGLIKPSKEYFESVKMKLDFDSHEVLYIDDTVDNIDTGISFGLKSHLYEDNSKLEYFLKLNSD